MCYSVGLRICYFYSIHQIIVIEGEGEGVGAVLGSAGEAKGSFGLPRGLWIYCFFFLRKINIAAVTKHIPPQTITEAHKLYSIHGFWKFFWRVKTPSLL